MSTDTTTGTVSVLRAYRVVLDPNAVQREQLAQHAGAARVAFNYALGLKVASHREYSQLVAEHTYRPDAPTDPAEALIAARKACKGSVRVPGFVDVGQQWRTERGDEKTATAGLHPWWRSVSSYAWSSGFRDADTAWTNWLDSLAGRRAGRRVGYPRFKAKGRTRDAFRIYHDVKKPTIRAVDARHLLVPRLGPVRLHSNLRRLVSKQRRGLIETVQSVTISRRGHRWEASLLVRELMPTPHPSRAQRAAGAVGVDVGVHHLAALSTGQTLPNPRHLRATAARLARAQQALARTQRGSSGRWKARQRVGRLQAQVAEQRRSHLHQITKQLTTGWARIAVEDLNVAGMTGSARGTLEAPGRQVRQKAGLNRAILDVAFGEIRRQLDYKTGWYGAELAVADRWAPTSKTCSACRQPLPGLTLADRTICCPACGYTCDRDVNAAVNIIWAATGVQVTPDSGGPTIQTPARAKPTSGSRRSCRRPTPTTSGTPEAHIGMPDEPPHHHHHGDGVRRRRRKTPGVTGRERSRPTPQHALAEHST